MVVLGIMRLIRYLQQEYNISRRKITWLIDDKSIWINQNLVVQYSQELMNHDILVIKSKDITINKHVNIEKYHKDSSSSQEEIILFNKPVGYVVSKSDPHNKTIYQLLPSRYKQYYYLGRLDKNSHGLVLLTKDPSLVHQRSHPSKWVEKEYIVQLDKKLSEQGVKRCLQGVQDEDELLKAIKIKHKKNIWRDHNTSIMRDWNYNYHVVLLEWKKRHIRRMFMSLWYKVEDLQRIREGKYTLGNLKLWEYIHARQTI